jgi:transcriptional regulator with XRE-family HTH domain
MKPEMLYPLRMPKLPTTDRDAVRFGAILKRLRLSRGWTIIIAAQRCGMNPNYLGSLEKGGNMPSVDTLLEVADVYGTSAAEIVREVEDLRRADRARHAAAVAAAMTPSE